MADKTIGLQAELDQRWQQVNEAVGQFFSSPAQAAALKEKLKQIEDPLIRLLARTSVKQACANLVEQLDQKGGDETPSGK